jgi:hypothetical protein
LENVLGKGELNMAEVLSYEQIKQQYDGEWVLIAYTELDETLKPIAGEVIAHSVDRDVVYDALPLRGDRGVAIDCFVKIPEDVAYIL